MDDTPTRARSALAEWLDAIAEGEADLAAGRIVPGEQVMRELRESLARLEASKQRTPAAGSARPSLIGFTAKALRQINTLRQHYEKLDRPEAVRNFIAAMQRAAERIEADPAAGLPAPRPYPELARPRRAWVQTGRYWALYRITKPPVIVAVFYDSANIPGRL